MVGALFWCKGDGLVCTTAGVVVPPIGFPVKVKLFKHIQELSKYSRFDTKLLTGKYPLVLN